MKENNVRLLDITITSKYKYRYDIYLYVMMLNESMYNLMIKINHLLMSAN